MIVASDMEEVAWSIVTVIKEAKEGTFVPHRENNELTRTLKNPEHPGQARDIGMVPWKVAWAEDSSYKTHRKSMAK